MTAVIQGVAVETECRGREGKRLALLCHGHHVGRQGETAVGVALVKIVVAQRGVLPVFLLTVDATDGVGINRTGKDADFTEITPEGVGTAAVGTYHDSTLRTDGQEIVLLAEQLSVEVDAFHPTVVGDNPVMPRADRLMDSIGMATALK